jgi:hypothetical protein
MESFEATVANVERKRQDLLAGVGG